MTDKQTKLINDVSSISASGNDPSDPAFFLFVKSYGSWPETNWPSGDRRYLASGEKDNSVWLEDVATGRRWQMPHLQYSYSLIVDWSPVGSLLAITENSSPVSVGPLPDDGFLRIYDPDTNEFVASFPGVHYIKWSPDGERLIYYSDVNQPCILEWRTGDTVCVGVEHNRYVSGELYDFDWSPDARYIGYIYFNPPDGTGGVCIKNLNEGEITCPTSSLTELPDHWYVRSYGFSPDGHYITFTSDRWSCPVCDFSTEYKFGVVALDGSHLWYPTDYIYASWRPTLEP